MRWSPAEQVLTLRKRIGYGLGGAVFSIKEAAYAAFVLLFYTQVLGLSGAWTGSALFVAVLVDCLSDPVIGAWSDKLNSRWGRRHPFMLAGCLPMGLGFIGLFSPPDSVVASQALLGCWLLFWSIWIRTLLSVFAIPHLAMSAEISSNYRERSAILGTRLVIVGLATVLVPATALTLLFTESGGVDGRFEAGNYPIYGIASCIFTWAVGLGCIWQTREYAVPGSGHSAHRHGLRVFFSDFLLTLSNRNFRNLAAFELSANVSYGILITLLMMTNIFFWELSSGQIAILLAGPSILGVSAAMPAMSWIGRHLAKHTIVQLCCVLLVVDAVWLYALRFLDWIPANGHPLVFTLLFIQMLLWMFLFILRGIASQSITADIADEHDLAHGRRQEGALFAASAFAQKMATGLGPLYGGLVLDMINLNQGMLPGSVDQGTLNGLALATMGGIVLPLFAAWYFASRVSMSEERLNEIQAQLAHRQRPGPIPGETTPPAGIG